MDTAIPTAVITAAVTVVGTMATYRNRHKDSIDKRIDVALDANHQLIEDYSAENVRLLARVTRLEEHRSAMDNDLLKVRESLSLQAVELLTMRQQNNDWRQWAGEVTAWCAMAMGIITGLGGQIPHPPPVPKRYSADV